MPHKFTRLSGAVVGLAVLVGAIAIGGIAFAVVVPDSDPVGDPVVVGETSLTSPMPETSLSTTTVSPSTVPETSTTTSSTVPESTSTSTSTSTTVAPPTGPTTHAVADAGTVTIAVEGSVIRVLSTAPAPGWTVEVERGLHREVEVSFRSSSGRVDFNAELEDGEVRIRIRDRRTDGGTTTTTPGSGATTQTFTSDGGSITVMIDGDELTLTLATPAPGYSVDVHKNEGDRIEVRFENGDRESRIELRLEDGELSQRIENETDDDDDEDEDDDDDDDEEEEDEDEDDEEEDEAPLLELVGISWGYAPELPTSSAFWGVSAAWARRRRRTASVRRAGVLVA